MRGVDSLPGRNTLILKIDIVADDRRSGESFLRRLSDVLGVTQHGEASHPQVTPLVGFSARFFKGALRKGRDENSAATRFAIEQPVPTCLRMITARGDGNYRHVSGEEQIRRNESDLLIVLESDCENELQRAERGVLDVVLRQRGNVVGRSLGRRRSDGIGHLGFKGGVSNLQDIRKREPDRYRRYVYVCDGKAGSREYDGGTYLVYRKYIKNTGAWWSPDYFVRDENGVVRRGDEARGLTMGRNLRSQRVIDAIGGGEREHEVDSAEARYAPSFSHIRQANPRGAATSAFGDPIVPRDVRILRRSCPFEEIDATGRSVQGLLFMCFQADIQEYGFEFINNQWLHATGFLGRADPLLDPSARLVEPVDGCYYFVPPARSFVGDVFFHSKELM